MKTKKALENSKKTGFTRQKDSRNKGMRQYEKRNDVYSKENRKHF